MKACDCLIEEGRGRNFHSPVRIGLGFHTKHTKHSEMESECSGEVELEDLQDSVVQFILLKTDAKSTATVGCLSRRWQKFAADDHIWSHFCAKDFAVSSLNDPSGRPCSSFKETYKKWVEAFGMYPLSLVRRAKHCWDTIRNWTSSHFPEVTNTLAHGASEEEIKKTEEILGWQLPVPVRVLYRFCNAQEMLHNDYLKDEQLAALGLIGGYCFYDRIVNVQLLPLHQILKFTNKYVRRLRLPKGSKHIIIAASCNINKFFFLDCSNGQLYVGTRRLVDKGELMPCVSGVLVHADHGSDRREQHDSMLMWLEEYGRQLEAGMFRVRIDGGIRSISLFPELEPLCSRAVTHGVQVRSSAVFVPELSDLEGGNDKYYFCYSIRMCLLPQENITQGKYLSSCQLARRHWIIRTNNTTAISEYHGEAVIGQYPHLKVGGDVFVYESCSPLQSSSGSMEGDFTFVPGRLSNPEGPEFSVRVAPFPLQVPQYIF